MGFGLTVTVSASTNTNSPDEAERSAQVGFWGPKKKIWLSYLFVGEGKKIIKKTWQLTLVSWKVWEHFRKLEKKDLKEMKLFAMLKSDVTNAIIFTTGAYAWVFNWVLWGSFLSLYLACLFIVGASAYWYLFLTNLAGKNGKKDAI